MAQRSQEPPHPRGCQGEQEAALPLPSTWLLSFCVPWCPPPTPGAASFHPEIPLPSLPSPIREAAFKQVLGRGGRGGCKPIKEHGLKGDRSGWSAAPPMARAAAGDRPVTLSAAPRECPPPPPPAAHCLCAVSVPALMCHVSSGGFPGAAARSPAKLSSQESGSLLPELCCALPPQPPEPGFWGRIRDKQTDGAQCSPCWSPRRPTPGAGPWPLGIPLSGNKTASLPPCRKGQNQLRWPPFGPFFSSQLPSPGSGPRGTSLSFSCLGFLHRMTAAHMVPSPGPSLRAPDVAVSPLGNACSGVVGILINCMNFHLEQSGKGKS